MNIQDILTLVGAHNYLALFLLVVLYARKLVSADSKFPVTVPPQWTPVVSGGLGLIYGGIVSATSGATLGVVLLTMAATAAATGFLDGILQAIGDHSKASKFFQALVFIFDDVFGVSRTVTTTTTASVSRTTTTDPPTPRNVARARLPRRLAMAVATATLLGALLLACLAPRSPAQQAVDAEQLFACVEANWGQPVLTVAANCTIGEIAVAEDAIADIEALFPQTPTAPDAGVAVALHGSLFPYKSNPRIMARVALRQHTAPTIRVIP